MFHHDIIAVEVVKSDRCAGHIDKIKMFIRIKRRAGGAVVCYSMLRTPLIYHRISGAVDRSTMDQAWEMWFLIFAQHLVD